MVKSLAKAIIALDLSKTTQDDCGKDIKIIGVMSNSRYEWLILCIASWFLNITLVPLYNTLGTEAIQHILKETKMEIIFANSKSIPVLCELAPDQLKTIVSFDDNFAPIKGAKIYTFKEILDIG